MAVTYSSTLLRTYRSIVTAATVSLATTASESITVVHQLGASPHEVRVSVRSLTSSPSGCPVFQFASCNASQATVNVSQAPNLGAFQGTIDIICEFTPSIVQ